MKATEAQTPPESDRLQAKINAKLKFDNARMSEFGAIRTPRAMREAKPKPLGIHAAVRNAIRVRFAYTMESVDEIAKAYRLPRDIALRILRTDIGN